MRKEKDSLGEVMVPSDKYFGAQTQRACENFKIGAQYFPQEFIQAHAIVKKAAARVNQSLGALDSNIAQAIDKAADEVIQGKLDEHFPLVVWQSGSATQFNMNVNEVIANRAIEMLGGEIGSKTPVHPNDHVNMAQSTNDTVPTSIHIATLLAVCDRLMPELRNLHKSLKDKAQEFQDIIKIGRTHLQDATPLTLGQEFSGYAAQIEYILEALEHSLQHVRELTIGGTAVGTGLNTQEGYDKKMVEEISQITGHDFMVTRSKFAGLSSHEAVVQISSTLKNLAASLMKIANDIRWMGSGPRSGLGEIILPANEPGSSIMPGKVNPTQCEMVTMVACQVFGNDATISMSGSMGNFELNVFKPVIIYNLMESINILTDACKSFREKAITGIVPNKKKIQEHVTNSLMLVTALNKHIGYDKASKIALKAWREDKTLQEAALELGFVTEEQFAEWVKPEQMIQPSKS